MPLANSLLLSADVEYKTYPLELILCRSCSLVQLSQTVPPEEMFTDYSYLTSCSPPMVEHARKLAERVLTTQKPKLVMEIGSNDGYLLQHYANRRVRVLGIDPSERAASAAAEKGVPTLTRFFNLEMARGIDPRADIIHANNVLAHVPDLNDFVAGLALLLKPSGVLIVEVPYLCQLIDKTAFDQVYHEHVFQFSLTALSILFIRHGLIISDAEEISVHGGSLRLWISKRGAPSRDVRRLISQESLSVKSEKYYADFSSRVSKCVSDTQRMLEGRTVAGFGAAAKATIFLNACGITFAQMACVADDTPSKQGKFIPGTGIPVVPVAEWLAGNYDHTLITCWNFAQDVAHKYRISYKGKFFTWYSEMGVPA